tara:strand:- start:156 stop:320 length:165 start_codon:yes stop_codon:yes gene_type:complete
MSYKYCKDPDTGKNSTETVYKIEDKLWIPLVEGNRHYEEYKKWLDEGNTPEDAE